MCNMMLVVQLSSPSPGQAWQALYAASGYEPSMGKIIIAVDEDADPADLDAVVWALSFRMQPAHDIRILEGMLPRLDPSVRPGPGATSSALLTDATRGHTRRSPCPRRSTWTTRSRCGPSSGCPSCR